ncbi:glycosyltransferase [Nguyenibacter sp. L1]|uniref:glycosyltransferase n=1 Tax=Nguyenibacter sp. L1 TaxID=3049350 RepID=UPI002B4A67F9|nr:glycosyltransferase [Nguyenibacter sp. L1]WRH87780.1 glycosyltransferase [Nguyenibacter sp. L1]
MTASTVNSFKPANGDLLRVESIQTNVTSREAILHREIARLMSERDELRATCAAFEARETQLQTECDRLSALDAECQALRADNATLQALIAALYDSTSWRLTRPLRRAITLLRGLSDTGHGEQPILPPAVDSTPPPRSEDAMPATRAEPPAAPPLVPATRGHMLVVADMLPLYDQHSGGLRMLGIIDMLAEQGWQIIFASATHRDALPGSAGTPVGRIQYEDALRERGVTRILYGTEEITPWFRDPSTRLDRAFLSFPGVAMNFMPLVRLHFPEAMIVFDMVDFHGLRQEREAQLLGDEKKHAEARRIRDTEVALALAADVTLAVTAEERDAMLAIAPRACVKVLPNVFDAPESDPPDVTGRKNLFFIGGFWHKPNGDGVHWFVREVWPLIRETLPDVRFTIAGSNMDNDILALGQVPGIDVAGYVPDVQPYLDSHRIFVAPLRYGAGMKGKVGQSLAGGLPVVATTVGAEGMGLEDGVNILIADDPAAFADAVIRLYRDDVQWTRLSAAGRDHILNTLSRDVVRKILQDALDG